MGKKLTFIYLFIFTLVYSITPSKLCFLGEEENIVEKGRINEKKSCIIHWCKIIPYFNPFQRYKNLALPN